jgi:TolB protein
MRKTLKFCIISILLFATHAYAALDLELTQGVDKALPIAIMSFSEHHDIGKIISSDLQNSGRFKVVNIDAPQQLSYGVHAVNYAYWAEQKIDNVVIGGTRSLGKKYRVTFQLLDVYGKSILLDEDYTIPKDQLRSLAHHISDLIYQQLTGECSIFSTKIAYVLVERKPDKSTQHSLIVTDADGYDPKLLLVSPAPIMSPAWSPTGQHIAYVSFEHNKAAIYVQDVATGKRELKTEFPGINGAPAWSPDGTKLALVLTKTGYPKIYLLDLKTKKLQQITYDYALDTEPNWAPDGKSIIFTSDRGGSPQIYQLDLQTEQIQRLTYQGDYNARASFTPDGKSIVMITRDNGAFNIAMQDLASNQINILTESGINKSPSIAPNGRMIVYATNKDGQGVLAEVSVDGTIKLTLPAEEGDVQEPAWSPFLN